MNTYRFVFVDRDGTLIQEVGYGHRLEDYALLPGVIDALHDLRDAGYRFAIVTNQSGLGRGIFKLENYEEFHGRLLDDLAAADITIEKTYMCPHAPSESCTCRKPNPSSLFNARDELGANLAESWMIGDHVKDVTLAANAGASGILVLTGHGEEEHAQLGDTPVSAVVADLRAAANHILGRS
ncbi:MAG: HAD family hydrolase [Candidatus Binatia bacterium]|nr:HAD family hydrolase [Candidatus Binatia bacterium]